MGGISQAMAQQICREGSFELPCSADTALPLFTPQGEREWIKTWNPQPIFPETIDFRRDTVFRTDEGDEEAVWTIVDADCEARRAEYVRVAPASHTAHITVKIEPLAAERSLIHVGYTVTAYGPRASSLLDAFSEEAYREKMCRWQQQIEECLTAKKVRN